MKMRVMAKTAKECHLSYLCGWLNAEETALPQADIEKVAALLLAKDSELRIDAARVAGLYYDPYFEANLIRLLWDRRLLVRVHACDSLSNSSNAAVCEKIIPLMRDFRRMARGYAFVSYSDIVLNAGSSKEQALRVLKPRFAKEKNAWVRVFGIEAVAQLGDKEVLRQLYQYIGDKNHHTRRIALKCAGRFLGDLDRERLLALLREQRKKEDSASITAEIDKLVAQMNDLAGREK